LPAIQNFTADRMSLVTPPNSNGWTIPLKVHRLVTFVGSAFEFCTFLHSICLNIKAFSEKN
jgi:hypothetical protein